MDDTVRTQDVQQIERDTRRALLQCFGINFDHSQELVGAQLEFACDKGSHIRIPAKFLLIVRTVRLAGPTLRFATIEVRSSAPCLLRYDIATRKWTWVNDSDPSHNKPGEVTLLIR